MAAKHDTRRGSSVLDTRKSKPGKHDRAHKSRAEENRDKAKKDKKPKKPKPPRGRP